MDIAAGIAWLIKTILCLYHKTLVPSLHYNSPNPKINFKDSPFYVNTELKRWESNNLRMAGVSSFGLGGTNSHILLQEAPKIMIEQEAFSADSSSVINISAHTRQALQRQIKNLVNYLEANPILIQMT